ncbi:hypothetical protein HY212_06805 [Candidatus Pacearchaeota archaeon]|nr:hypothetical protein [Candidatus Pacearchaeota archaeon]
MDIKKISLFAIAIAMIGSVIALTVNQEVVVTVVPGLFNLYSPVNGMLYLERMILINATMDGRADLRYANDGSEFTTICRNCSSYSKKKPFDDGVHSVIFEALFDGGPVFIERNFTVDTKVPRIKDISPTKGFAFGDFGLDFQEENPTQIILHYGSQTKEIELNTCLKDGYNNYKCSTHVDLSGYDGGKVEYWFSVEDIAGRIKNSKHKTLSVDLTKPVLTVNLPIDGETYGKKVPFNLSVSEKVTLQYKNNNPAWKGFCDNCNGYGFNSKKTRAFDPGTHDITIRATDQAGNFDEKTLSFFVG